ncbi:MAG: ATP-binding protein [Gemmatimonas sp.]
MSTLRYPRILRAALLADLELYPVVALMGARQVGKSTLGRELADGRGMAYRTLDDRDVLQQAIEDPEGLLAELGGSGFIDEAQRAPSLFLALKAVVDREQRVGRYLLSGSNQPVMSGAVGDSLLGRAAYRTLRPITLSEQRLSETGGGWDFLFQERTTDVLTELERRAEASGELDWRTAALTGGFPRALAAPPELRQRLLNDYVEVFANRDVRDLLAIESSDRFEQFTRLVATRTGQVLNANGLSTDLGIPVSTVRRWLGALERSFLLELIPAYSRNAGHRVIKAPKIFMTDSALAIAAAQEPEPTGFHLENLIANDLLVWRDAATGRNVHHWRTQSGQEVDFVVEHGKRLLPVEVKTANAIGSRDARHLTTFLHGHAKSVRGLLLSADAGIREIRDGVIAAPWWAVL